jgi:8-oxo-dGTP pyrophosphatase MutT (NUDIX family)
MARSVTPWRVLSSAITYSDKWLTLRADECLTAEGRRIAPFHVLEFPDWVNVVAFAQDGRLILVREYRHGAGAIVLGLVSGTVETVDQAASVGAAQSAARRELAEETGYRGGTFEKVLECWPNPANQTNRATTFLATGVELAGERKLDATEAIEVVHADLAETLRALRTGEIVMQAMHVAGLWAAVSHILAGRDGPLRGKVLAGLA